MKEDTTAQQLDLSQLAVLLESIVSEVQQKQQIVQSTLSELLLMLLLKVIALSVQVDFSVTLLDSVSLTKI